MEVYKGTVQSMSGSTATVVHSEHPDIVTRPLVVPFYWRETMGKLKVGDEVYFFEDDEHGGYIIGRTDGEWDNNITADVTLTGSLSVSKDVTASGSMTAAQDVTGGGVSLKNHTHGGDSGGQTTPPN